MISKELIEQEAIKLVLSTKNHFKGVRDSMGYKKEWEDAKNAYFNGCASNYSGAAAVRTGALHQAVERIVPKLDKVIFPTDGKFFAMEAKNEKDEAKQLEAEMAQSLIDEQYYDMNVRQKMIGIFRDLCIFGTVFVKVHWREEVKERFKRVFDQKKNTYERQKVWESLYSNPDFYAPAIENIYADPKDEDLEGSLIEKIPTTFQELWKHRERTEDGVQKGIYNTDAVKKLKEDVAQDSEAGVKNKEAATNGYSQNPNKDALLAYEYWGDVPAYFFTQSETDKENRTMIPNALIVIGTRCANEVNPEAESQSAVLLRLTDNPFDHNCKPYIRSRYIKVNGLLYGLGVISRVTIPLEEELNTLRTQTMDNRTFMLRVKWLKLKEANITDEALKDVANQIIETADMNGLRDLRPPDFTASTTASENLIKQDIQDATGASKLLSGTPSGGSLDRTAGGIATVVSAGLERFELVVTCIEEELMKQLTRHIWMLNQQYILEGRDVLVSGGRLLKVNPAEIGYNFDVKFLGIKEIGEKGYKVNTMNITLQNLAPFIPLGINPKPLLFEIMRLQGMGDVAEQMDVSPEAQLEYSPEGEVQLLQMGKKVKIDLNDDHQAYIEAYLQLLNQPKLPDNVKQNTIEALGQRQFMLQALKLLQTRMSESPNNA